MIEVPIDNEIRRHEVENGVILLYRKYTPVSGMLTANWWFTPEHCVSWRRVKAPSIRRRLDAGEHPRNGRS